MRRRPHGSPLNPRLYSQVIDKEKLQEKACTVGAYLGEKLYKLQEKHEMIGWVDA